MIGSQLLATLVAVRITNVGKNNTVTGISLFYNFFTYRNGCIYTNRKSIKTYTLDEETTGRFIRIKMNRYIIYKCPDLI